MKNSALIVILFFLSFQSYGNVSEQQIQNDNEEVITIKKQDLIELEKKTSEAVSLTNKMKKQTKNLAQQTRTLEYRTREILVAMFVLILNFFQL